MPIYNLQQLRDSAPAEFRELPPEDLVREYSRSTGVPFSQAADFFGVAPRGTLAEMGRQALGGALVDVPRMVGQGLKATGLAPEYGQELVTGAEERAYRYEPDVRGRGLIGQAGVLGARGLAPVLSVAPLAFVPGGQFAAPAAAATLFGTSAYQDTYEKVLAQTGDEAAARAAALRVGAVQGPLEGVATAVGLRTLRPALAAVRGAPTTAGVAQAATQTGVVRPFVRGQAINIPTQAGTEVLQDVGTELIERGYGAAPEDLGEIARQSALGGAGLAAILAPLGLGGSVQRARRAESLKQALYGENTPVEVRAKAMDLVMAEARRQGVAEQDVDAWFSEQLAAEDARTEALRVAEAERRNAEISLLGEKAQELTGLQTPTFSSLDQQRAFEEGMAGITPAAPFASLDQQRAFEQGLAAASEANVVRAGQQYQDLMGARASTLMQAQDLGQQAQQVMAPAQRGLEAARQAGEQWQEIRATQTRAAMDIEDMGREWQKMAAELPQPVTGELTRAQKVALRGPQGGRLRRTVSPVAPVAGGPMATTLLQPPQAAPVSPLPAATPAPVSQLTERPVSPPSGAPAVSTPAAPVAAGGSLPAPAPAPAAPKGRGKKAGPVTAGQTVRVNDTDVTLNEEQAAAWNAAQEAYDGKVRRAQAITNYQERESQLRAAGMQLSAERRKITGALTTKEKAAAAPAAAQVDIDAEADEASTAQAQKAIDDLGLRPLAGGGQTNLQASVRGGNINVAGKASFGAKVLASAKNAFIRGVGKEPKSQSGKLAQAARAFGEAYRKYLNAAGNLVPTESRVTLKPTKQFPMRGDQPQAEARAGANVAKVRELWQAAQTALSDLGAAAGNNAKNVEVMIRLVKDDINARKAELDRQLETAMEPDSDVEVEPIRAEMRELEQLDLGLSQGWAAAKRGTFRTDTDMLDVRGGEVRTSKEEQREGFEQPLVRAAKYGAAVGPRAKQETGFQGVLNYIRSKGTPFERLIAKAVSEVFKNTKNPPNLVFAEGTPGFDPTTNTVTMSPTASPEVALHEALHAALQWFVHSNPKNPLVVQLLKSVDKVVKYDTAKLSEKAAAVQKVLADLKKDKRPLDAVLELVSYGNTLVEFRKALEAMPTRSAPTSFVQAAKDVWNMILATVRRMLNVPQSVASDVIMDSFKLLEEASRAEYKGAVPGKRLEAAVTSAQPVEPGATMPASNAAIVAAPSGVLPSDAQLARYSKTMFPRFALTEMLFNKLGWADWMSAADKKFVTPMSNWIQENTPALARSIAWVNSHYGLPSYAKADIVKHLTSMKDNRRGGTALFEKAHSYITSLPADQARAYLQYMNDRFDFKRGLRPEPKFTGDDTFSGAIADRVVDFAWKYMTEGAMDAKSRDTFVGKKVGDRWVGGIKFTEGFIFPKSVNQLASNSFGARNLRALKSDRTKSEVGLDAIRFRTDAQGDAILDDKFIGLYNHTPELQARLAAGETLADILPDEFISADLFSQATPLDSRGQPMIHDSAFTWDLEKKGKDGYKFSAHYDAAEALKTKSTLDVANAFQNTMTLLANAYATRQFADGLSDIGVVSRGEDGKPTVRDGSSVVFDSLDQLNQALNSEGVGSEYKPQTDRTKWTRKVTKESLINISTNEARADAVQALFRNRAQWVRVPGNEQVYGALAGKIVNGSVWAAIQDASDRRPAVKVPYVEAIMRFHKGSKTVWNPATWGTNVATNYAFALVDDIPMATIAHASRLYAAATLPPAVRKKMGINITPQEEQLMVRILGSNALLGTFSSNEIKAGIYEAMRSNLEGPERNVASRLMQFAGVEKGRIETIEKLAGKGVDKAQKVNELLQEWYAAQDNVFRVASALNYIGKAADQGQKVTDELVNDAGRHARDAFLDYDIDAKAIRIMRQTAFPFISWPYAATKLVGRLAVHKPWKLVNLYAGYAILDAMLSSMSGDDEDELRAAMPEYMREKLLFGLGPNAYVRIPFMGDSDNPVYYHLGKYMFPSSLADSSPEGFAGLSWWPTSLTPTGPFVGTVMSMGAGIDPFTGNKLTDESASDFEAFAARVKAVQGQFVPNLPFINSKETEKLMDAAAGRLDKTPNHASLMMARYMGLRFYDFNVDASLEQQDKAAVAIEKEYKMAISKLRRQQERLERPDWDAFYEREAELLKRLEKRIGELRGEEPEEE